MILVTPAAGVTGRAVVAALSHKGATVRALTRKNSAALSTLEAHESSAAISRMRL